jgi:hypothetical protein
MIILFVIGISFSVSAGIDLNNLPQDIKTYYRAHNNIVCLTTAEERELIRKHDEMPLTLKNDPRRLSFIYEQIKILIKMTNNKNNRPLRINSHSFKFILPGKYVKIQKVNPENYTKKSKCLKISLKIILYSLNEEESEQYIAHFNRYNVLKTKIPDNIRMKSPKWNNSPQIHSWYIKNGEWKINPYFLQYL